MSLEFDERDQRLNRGATVDASRSGVWGEVVMQVEATARLWFAITLAALAIPGAAFASPGDTQLVSAAHPDLIPVTGTTWSEPNGASISSNGRYVAFTSDASNLVA